LPSLSDICRICDELWGDVTLPTLHSSYALNRREVLHCKC
jgi:hypothetical protein